MKKILIIPHSADMSIKTRWMEIAKAVSDKTEVHYLVWETAHRGFMSKSYVFLKNALRKNNKYVYKKINFIKLPVLTRPWSLAGSINGGRIERYIAKNNIDILVNSNTFLFSMPRRINYKYIFDFVDLPARLDADDAWSRFVWKSVDREVQKADYISCVSLELADFIKSRTKKTTFVIPNGVNVKEFEDVKDADVTRLKKKLGIENKFIIGYIGKKQDYVDLDFLKRTLEKIKNVMPDILLLVIGTDYSMRNEHMLFTGPVVSEEIAKYFCVLDAGTLPNIVFYYEKYASHLKILEYTIAGKYIISTPLDSVKRLHFPNVVFADLKEKEWIDAVKIIRNRKSRITWKDIVLSYDWSECVKPLLEKII